MDNRERAKQFWAATPAVLWEHRSTYCIEDLKDMLDAAERRGAEQERAALVIAVHDAARERGD